MRGFTDTTKTHYTKGGPTGGLKGAAKTATVLSQFRGGGAQKPAPSTKGSKSGC